MEPSDYPALRRAELAEFLAFRWRHHGRHEPPETFGSALWADAPLHFVAHDLRSSEAIGIISAYGAYMEGGSCHLAAARLSSGELAGSRILGALGLAIDYIFDCWPMRKIYFETTEYNFSQFDGALSVFLVEEARLREHIYLKNRYWDQITLTLWKETWLANGDRIRRLA